MKDFLRLLQEHKQYKEITRNLRAGKDCVVNGLWGSSAMFLAAALANERLKKDKAAPHLLLVVSHIEEAENDFEDLNTFLPRHTSLFPAIEDMYGADFADNADIQTQRIQVLNQILHHDVYTGNRSDIIVAPILGLLQAVPSRKTISEHILKIQRNHEHPQEELIAWLQDHHYQVSTQVENAGEYALRGGIIDVFPFASDTPYRIEYFGDEVESIRRFHVESQLSEQDLDACQILALDKMYTANALPEESRQTSLLTYLSKDTWVVLVEPAHIEDRARKVLASIDAEDGATDLRKERTDKRVCPYHPFDEVFSQLRSFRKITVSKLPVSSNDGDYTFHVKSADIFPQKIQEITAELGKVIDANTHTVVFCDNEAEEQRFQEIIAEAGLKKNQRLSLCIGRLHCGFQFSDIHIAILAHHEIFHRYQQRRESKKPIQTRAIDSFLDLKKGDYVVHISHGIGRYLGMDTLEEGGQKREYLTLEFDEGTKIYVPATKIELVQKYIGSSDHRPRLDKIGSKYWEVRKKRAEHAVRDVASDLLHIQALRNAKEGIAYQDDSEWQREFEESFLYEETPDQLQVIEEIKRDMESKRPMDRLVCGDVGYGKTELAMRAAFKAVMGGKQVAVLVPTTILAQQHYATFSERMADYPVKLGVLSRFKTRREQKDTLEKAAAGFLDILIGTHRLLQKDVYFKDLGLVIIDEEQRFGVEHKERLKRLRQTVDVLTLTATPIPRTLHMSLLGIKDISSLNTPPLGRQAIHTQIVRFNPERIRQAIMLELNRDGQVYFVHNRVYNIERVARTLAEIVPEARIMTVHGQMDEKLMEQRMRDFIDGRADILVATTIIESGLDIPNVNTIFINCADTFGLADLHQLRGRVGRYKHRAYAYIILPVDRPITPEAEKRVKAIEEFAELGAGFRIAMRDLEIRGAGNILGTEQHGHIAAVGYEMYCRLLELAVRKARHEPIPEPIDVSIDLHLESFIPHTYIREDALKMDIYRRLNRSATFQEVRTIAKEMADRFGDIPHPVKNLLSESELRILAQQSKIRSMVKVDGILVIHVANLKRAEASLSKLKKYLRVINDSTLHLGLPAKKMLPEDLLDFLKKSIKI
ncbi:MAG: transcription-repair coupling factor [Candidatus Brocadia sp.]|nr:transcription-repair coupling factor [Candidatus Brocadia sp.]MDG5996304.1 transcription-repair coupling factor [Candidatus Brocadia sp.]